MPEEKILTQIFEADTLWSGFNRGAAHFGGIRLRISSGARPAWHLYDEEGKRAYPYGDARGAGARHHRIGQPGPDRAGEEYNQVLQGGKGYIRLLRERQGGEDAEAKAESVGAADGRRRRPADHQPAIQQFVEREIEAGGGGVSSGSCHRYRRAAEDGRDSRDGQLPDVRIRRLAQLSGVHLQSQSRNLADVRAGFDVQGRHALRRAAGEQGEFE